MARDRDAYAILVRMKGGTKAQGFTIIETLIVLAVTAGLFAATALIISGRQNRTEFEQAINEVRSQIQQVVNNVAVGYYPNTSNFSCAAGAAGPVLTSTATGQGQNAGCIFLGKAIQFDSAGTDPQQFRVFTVAGLQKDIASGNEATTYAQTRPTVVAPSLLDGGIPDNSQSEKLLYGLTVSEVYYDSPKRNIGAVAFVNSLAQYSSGAVVSGSQQVNIVPIRNTSLGVTPTAAATAINTNLLAFADTSVNPVDGVHICFVGGGVDKSGLITIGSNGRQLSVTLSIKGNTTCA